MSAAANQGPLLNRVTMAQFTIAVVFVLLRFFVRGFVVKKFGLDDVFIFIAITLGLGQTATIMLQVEHGRGRHSYDLTEEEYNLMLRFKWVNMLIYFLAIWAVKMSILALYHRIGSGKRGLPLIVQPPAIWATAGFISAFTLAVILVQVFSCLPVTAAWDVKQMSKMCIDGATFMHVQGGINVFTDVVLLLYPLPLLRLMKFNKRQRTALIIIFSIGLTPVIASSMRLCEIIMSGDGAQYGMGWRQADSSWTWAWVPVWSQIEVDIGILTACLPCLSPLFRLWFQSRHAPRTMTPSMVTLPKYSGGLSSDGSFGSADEGEKETVEKEKEGVKGGELDKAKEVRWCEKELPAIPEKKSSFYDDASDEEEARQGGVRASSRRDQSQKRP